MGKMTEGLALAFNKQFKAQQAILAQNLGAKLDMTDVEKADLQLAAIGNTKLDVIGSEWQSGVMAVKSCEVTYNTVKYVCLVPHITQADWTPDKTPALWQAVKVEYAPFKQPTGAQDAYKKGDKVTFEGKRYESLIDGNTWSPTAYPAGWKLIT